jgi:ATP-dependent protease ClpP protease subunit
VNLMSGRKPINIELPRLAKSRPIFARAPGLGVRAADDSIQIFGEVGFDITPASIKSALAGKGDVHLQINSPGGSAFDGVAIYNLLVGHSGNVTAEVVGVAASAASIIAMAADELTMAKSAFLMIHNAWGITIGDHDAHAETGALLQKIDGALAGIYADRTGMSVGDIADLMNAETWIDADEAVDQGFADSVSGSETKNLFDLSVYRNAPSSFARRDDRGEVASALEVEKLLRAAGVRSGAAKRIATAGFAALSAPAQTNDALAAMVASAISDLENA